MPTLSLDRPPPVARPAGSTTPAQRPATVFRPRGPVRRLAAALVAGGLLAMAAAGVAVLVLVQPDRAGTVPAGAGRALAARPYAITVDGPGGVSVVSQVYEAGQTSHWHAHSGIHAVAVLSGTLTVYDADCRSETYGRDRPYIGGQDLHLVRNETAEPVEMVVTYVSAGEPAGPTRTWDAPSCWNNPAA